MAVNLEINPKVYNREANLAKILPVNYETHGKENIDKALELLDQGAKLFIIADHRSTADTTTGFAVAVKSKTEFDKLLKRSRVTIKDSYSKSRLFRALLSSFQTIGMVSPSMIDYPNSEEVMRLAFETITGTPGGNAITLNPEATRVRWGGMQQAQRGIVHYWHQFKRNPSSPPDEKIWFLPTAHERTEQQYPNGPLGGFYYIAVGAYKHKVKFFFGEPFSLNDVITQLNFLDVPRKDRSQMEADLVFNQVARLHLYHPEGNPDYADGEPILDPKTDELIENGGGYYARLNDRLVAAGVQFPDSFIDLSA
ncbi:MAG: hypothetical protein AAB521_05120 [Patescibacteria group bacterium]